MDMILKTTFQSISPAYELIGDVTVGSNTTQVDFTGLNIGKDDELLLVSDVWNPTGTAYGLNLTTNTHTITSYYRQYLYVANTAPSAGRSNAAYFGGNSGSQKSLYISRIKLTNSGYSVSQTTGTRDYAGTALIIQDSIVTSTFTMTTITSLRIADNLGNGIGTGSRFQLYKLVAEKVADIIVPSNTTSVDITGLNIGKDGEYYLVSDVASNMNGLLYYTINDNNTYTNYYSQHLTANNTTVSGGRVNNPRLLDGSASGSRTFATCNIKLTNSGYSVFQSNTTRNVGTSTVDLQKYYSTATFTASTIASIKMTAEIANGIGANSRFTLYKMK